MKYKTGTEFIIALYALIIGLARAGGCCAACIRAQDAICNTPNAWLVNGIS